MDNDRSRMTELLRRMRHAVTRQGYEVRFFDPSRRRDDDAWVERCIEGSRRARAVSDGPARGRGRDVKNRVIGAAG